MDSAAWWALGAGLGGIVIGALAGAVWSAKDFRRKARLDSYTNFVAAFLTAAGNDAPTDAQNLRDSSYCAVRLVASEDGGIAAKNLYESEATGDAAKAAAADFCVAVGKDITSWWRN